MEFVSHQVAGHGRGKKLGFPTINLEIPADFELKDGVYAAVVVIENVAFDGALHFGPVPTFGEIERSLEVFLLNTESEALEWFSMTHVSVQIIEKIRDVMKFDSLNELSYQIECDVRQIKTILGRL